MANTVDIEVRLEGAEEAKRGLKGLGGTAGDMAGHFEKFNSHLGEGLGEVVGNVEELGGSFGELGEVVSSVGKGGGASLMSLLPAFGAVAAAGFALYETYQMITGAAQEAEDAQAAMGEASSDLQSKLEALAEKGVIPSAKAMTKFTVAVLQSQLAKSKLENSYKKLQPVLDSIVETELELEKTIKLRDVGLGKVTQSIDKKTKKLKLSVRVTGDAIDQDEKIVKLRAKLIKLNAKLQTKAEAYNAVQIKVQKVVSKSAKMEADFEKKSLESTLARVSALAPVVLALEKENALFASTIKERGDLNDEFTKKTIELEHQKRAEELNTRIESIKTDVKKVKALEDELKARHKAFDAKKHLDEKYAELGREASSAEQERFDAESEKRLARLKSEQAKRIMLERQTENEMFSLRALGIKSLKDQGADQMAVLIAQYALERDMARENQNQLLMAEMRFEMAKTELLKSEEAKRQAERDKRQAEILKQIDERTKREQAYIDQAGEIADAFGGAFAEASFGALAMGESFKESISQIIFGLGKQAAVESLISTAKMFSSLAMGDLIGAANNLKAATGFAAGAVAAGVAGSALAGGGGGGGGSASPSGAPQIAPTPDRESAQETSTVFNINFGGAVIYDTKQAAERAMVDRLVGVMNQRNRGARRLNLGRS